MYHMWHVIVLYMWITVVQQVNCKSIHPLEHVKHQMYVLECLEEFNVCRLNIKILLRIFI